MSSFSIYNDKNFNSLITNSIGGGSASFSGLTADNANINKFLTLGHHQTVQLTSNPAGTGALVYDITANQFKGYHGTGWKTITSGATISATNKQVLFYDNEEITGSDDLIWEKDNNNNNILSLGTNSHLSFKSGRINKPPLASEGAVVYHNGDLHCLKGGVWTSLTQIGSGANAGAPANSIQFNNGVNQFGGHHSFTWDSSLKEQRLLGEPDYTSLTNSIVTANKNNIMIGSRLMTQATSNKTKGIVNMWPLGAKVTEKQIYRFHGHDFDFYSSLNPISDSMLYTGGQNANPQGKVQPPATMDLGMTSRVPFTTSNGSQGCGWIDLQWQEGGEDDPYVNDPYSDSGKYSQWDGQLLWKSGIPGIYIEERRWDRIFGRSNYTGTISLRSTYAPNINPNGQPVKGIDFYDIELAKLDNITEQTDLRLGSKMSFGMARLNVPRNTQGIGDLLVITTEKIKSLPGNGVDFSTPGMYGGASMYFRNIGPNAQPGKTGSIISNNYTALIDGVKGEFKALGSFQAGSSSAGATNTMTLNPDNLIATWKGPGLGLPVVSVGTFGVGVSGGIGFGQISLKGNNEVESLSMKGINASTGPAPFKSIDMSTGLAYFDNSFATNQGVNFDNVGVMSISQSLTNGQNNTNVLQISSAIDIGDPASYTGVNQNVLALKNSTGVGGVAVNLLTVDTGGFSEGIAHIRAAVRGVPSSTVAHTLVADMQSVGGSAATYGGSVLSLESDGLNGNTGTYFYNDPIAPLSGYSFLQARNTSVIGGKKLILDSDGSIKCSVSLTVSQNTASGSLPGDGGISINFVPIVGNNTGNGTTGGSLVTTTFSLPQGGANSPLQLQASGPTSTNSTRFAVLNPVRVIPNRTYGTPVYSPTTSFQICDLNTSGNPTNNENLMFWTKNTDISNGECLLMSSRPAGSKSAAQLKPIWTLQSGGIIAGNITGYCFRYYPEGNSFDAVNPITGVRLILSDDNPVTNANGGIVRVGKGKSRPKSTFTVGGGGWLESDVIDTRWTFTEVIDYGSTNSATGGNLIIGAGLTDCVQLSVDKGGNGNGYVNLGKTGCIISKKAANPAGGSTGPTNICNRNHNGYIGCPGVFPIDGTGIRGYSVLATTFSSVAKMYTAKNLAQKPSEQGYVCCSAVEAPQGVIIMRGRVQLTGKEARINLDTSSVAPGTLVVPHTNPNTAFPVGTVNAMYQNFTVSVSNAGILPGGPGTYPQLDFDVKGLSAGGGQVAGIIKISPISPSLNEVILNIRNFGPTNDIFVDWVVYCERKDIGYKKAGQTTSTSGFVTSYTNPISGTYDTWGTPAYTPGTGAPTNGVDLNTIYGEDNYIFE